MKKILRTTTALLLTLGLGFTLPKLMNSETIDTPKSQNDVIVKLNANSPKTLEESNISTDLSKLYIECFQSKNLKIIDNIEKKEENFPIKIDNLQFAVDVEDKVESNNQNSNKIHGNLTTVNTAKVGNVSQMDLKTPDTAATASEVTVSYDRYAKTTLNVRRGPGTTHPRISTLKAGEKVLVTRVTNDGWSYIESVKGYVSSSYLLETAPAAKPSVVQPPTTAPVTPPATTPVAPKPEPAQPTYNAYTMIVGGKTLPYKNGGISKGQSIIDANIGHLSTWGGAEVYSGTDNKNTHFIGHNPGAFDVLLGVSNGATIIVTDGNGTPTSYTVTKIFKVDDSAYNKSDGINYYNYMVSTRGGEVITLQTCLGPIENLIIRAEKK